MPSFTFMQQRTFVWGVLLENEVKSFFFCSAEQLAWSKLVGCLDGLVYPDPEHSW